MKRIRSLLQHMRVITSTWSRVLALIWKTNPWYVAWLLIFTFFGGLIPSLQIQVTTQIIQNAAEAIQEGRPTQLVHLAIFFGLLQGGLMILSSLLGIGQQQIQSLLQTKLANTIAIQIFNILQPIRTRSKKFASFGLATSSWIDIRNFTTTFIR